MDEQTQKLISDQFATLPKTVQSAIVASQWQKKVHDISKTFQLHVDQEGNLTNETFLVMLGLESPTSFENNLVQNIGVARMIASQIALSVNDQIFKVIKNDLQSIDAASEEAEIQAAKTESEENPTKESILEGIEHPVETIHPHAAFLPPLASQLAMPAPLDLGMPKAIPISSGPSPESTDSPIAPTSPAIQTKVIPTVTVMPNAGTSNIVHDRLSQMVQMAKQEIQTTPVKPAPKDAPKSTVDPYREAVN